VLAVVVVLQILLLYAFSILLAIVRSAIGLANYLA